jgi:hypothetical protein
MTSRTATLLLILAAAPVAAQSPAPARGSAAVEATAGYAGFIDESFVDHSAFGAGGRVHLSPRVSIGPEIIYMRGPGFDRDLFVTGDIAVDLLVPAGGIRSGSVQPFLVAGAGMMRHSDRFGQATFTSSEGAVTGGGGARVWLTDRVYALGEFRLGWEPHYRVTGGVGVLWR